MNQQQPPQQQQTPFSSGSLAAMDSIRNSLMMDDNQKRSALGMAISKFGQGMGNPANYERGGNGLGAAVASLGPATESYDAQNTASRSENASLIEYMRKLEHDQNEMARRKKEREDMMAYRNAQLNETKRYHDMHFSNMSEKQAAKASKPGAPVDYLPLPSKDGKNIALDLTGYPAMNRQSENQVAKEYRELVNLRKSINDIRETKDKLKKVSEENLFSPTGSIFGEKPAEYKERAANIGNALGWKTQGNKNLNDEARLRNLLNSQLEVLQVTAEKSKSGKSPTDRLMQRFVDHKVLPTIDNVMQDIDNKINWMDNEAKGKEDAYGLSLKTKRHIYDLPEELKEVEEGVPENTQKSEANMQSNDANVATIRQMFPDFADPEKYPDEKLLRWASTPEGQKAINGE
jgi:hypothetical protein